ncbi:polysaccharide biosynthesis protein [Seonamhaeicola sediminis]|uniref:Polysaccharide biosynthesis protein n=1 Tax=Seonamhaeicola sediminis TaxID=2528206 RepID=A0A562YGG9_9FLAO|nr:nucleoside-diphosphate sugar epimerase/dehydratase [Seonamhaeicola sediminis]TWO33973.1 polysaccharide biosynthesis protein [Seonamhaeicola sediminis]
MNRLKELIKLVLKNTLFKLGIEDVGYLSRWIVLWWDAQVVLVVLFLTSFIESNFTSSFANKEFLYLLILVEVVTALFFVIFKTYVGIIRHSSYVDAAKLFFSSLFSAITLLIINAVSSKLTGKVFFSPVFLIIFSLGLFCGLLLYRLLIKQIYALFIIEEHPNFEKVFILGVSQGAISLAVAIENELPKRFKVVGFLDYDELNSKKQVLGIPILHITKKVHVLVRANNATGIIVLEDDLKNNIYTKSIEECLDYNIKIYRAPSISEIDLNSGVNDTIRNIQIEDLLGRKPIEINNINILNIIKGRTILVTGGAGSIGAEIVNQLGRFKPKCLLVVEQAESALHNLTLQFTKKFDNIEFVPLVSDIRNKKALEFIFKEYHPEIIYHCAAYKHVPLMENNPTEAVSTNIQGSKNLADLSVKYNVDRFIMISTDKAVNPSNVMGATKRAAEMYVQSLYNSLKSKENCTKFITTRFGNVLGSNGSVVPLFKEQIASGGPVTITHPDIIRYFMTIPEACQLVMEASSMGSGGEIFIFDMGKAVKILDLAHKMIRLAGFIPNKTMEIKSIGLRPGEKLYEELLNDKSITLPTYHEKIMIVKENSDDYKFVNESIKKIVSSSNKNEITEIIKKLKELVPEYISLNSEYEILDSKEQV